MTSNSCEGFDRGRESGRNAALICGSVAFDTIMVFSGRFGEQILPNRIHMLNVSFLVPKLRREFGGCAGNIAYNLRLLSDLAYPMATVGSEFGAYKAWLSSVGVPTDHIRIIEDQQTAQAFITSDLDDNQITAFHPGAMALSHLNQVGDANEIAIGVIAPDGRDGMLQHAEQFSAAGIPFMFDPGQALPVFTGEELKRFIGQATWLAVNDYEWEVLTQRTGWSIAEVMRCVQGLIVTHGSRGSTIYANETELRIPCAKTNAIVDPTGCGDAYRAGIIHGLLRGLDWETTGRIAAVLGAIKIESRGTQNHSFTLASLEERFRDSFGLSLELAPS